MLRYTVILFILISICFSLPAQEETSIESLTNQLEQIENNPVKKAEILNKLGYAYWNKQQYTKAISSFEASIQINQELKNNNAIKTLYYNIGLIYSEENKYNLALEAFEKGLQNARNLKQKHGIYNGLINKASSLQLLENYTEASELLQEALSLAKEMNDLKKTRTVYGMLAEGYEAAGNSQEAMKYFDLFSTIDKHIKAEEIKEITAQSKEEVEKAKAEKTAREKELDKTTSQLAVTKDSLKKTEELVLKKQLELQLKAAQEKRLQEQLKNERLIRYGLVSFAVFVLLFVFIIYSQFRQKKKANQKLAESNRQINQQKEEIEQQRDLANKQKQKITDSIQYARRIQTALLPPENYISRVLPEHFVFFKPRDIVSGDFYWLTSKDEKVIFAAADCTGHGVPGAFMSMLGIAFLNEIVNKITENEHIYSLQANEILNQLRSYVIESLRQTGKKDEAKDGIDIAICILDLKSNKLQYAGAHNPLIIIREHQILQIKADRMPVSFRKNAKESFTNHEIEIKPEDRIYMYSDGFPDQIGGKKGMKYMSRKFKELLLSIHREDFTKQKEILEQTFTEWKGDYAQLDDILVAAFKPRIKKPVPPEREHYDFSDKTILIAEDTEMNFIFLKEALKNTGATILWAKDGEEAIKISEKEDQIDLILMDINMPGLDGFETTKRIKSRHSIPVIAQTALSIDDADKKAKEVGCDDFILKPIRLKAFLETLNTYLK